MSLAHDMFCRYVFIFVAMLVKVLSPCPSKFVLCRRCAFNCVADFISLRNFAMRILMISFSYSQILIDDSSVFSFWFKSKLNVSTILFSSVNTSSNYGEKNTKRFRQLNVKK